VVSVWLLLLIRGLQCDLRNIFQEMDSGLNVFVESLIVLSGYLFVVVICCYVCLLVLVVCWLFGWNFKLLLLSPDAMVAVRRRMRGFVVLYGVCFIVLYGVCVVV
jgi:hypothetical protein